MRGVLEATEGRGVKEDRRFDEEIEDEDKDADVQDRELHGDLEDAVEEQTEAAFGDGAAGEVALDLGLIGSKVRERKKKSACDPRPKGVAVVEIEAKVKDIHASERAREGGGIAKRDVGWQAIDDDQGGDKHPDHDHDHLLFLSLANSLCAA